MAAHAAFARLVCGANRGRCRSSRPIQFARGVTPAARLARQITNLEALKSASTEFGTMRRLAMRFQGLLRGGTPERLDSWLIDARASGIYAMQRFARTIRQDLEAVRNAGLETWSNGQTEGQINKLKTLKRAMYGRAG